MLKQMRDGKMLFPKLLMSLALGCSLIGCGGRGAAYKDYSMPPPNDPIAAISTLRGLLLDAGFVAQTLDDKDLRCGLFEDQETVARYRHSRYPDIYVQIFQSVIGDACKKLSVSSTYWVTGYTDTGQWLGGITIPPGSGWKPGQRVFRTGILFISFDERWDFLGTVKPMSPEATRLIAQMETEIRSKLGNDSLHVFSAETRRKLELYLVF